MNKKLILNLFASSSIFTSLISTLGIIHPAHASVNLGVEPDFGDDDEG